MSSNWFLSIFEVEACWILIINFVVSSPSPKRCPLGVNRPFQTFPNICRRKHLRIPQISKQICTEEQQFCLPKRPMARQTIRKPCETRLALREINIVCVSKTWRNMQSCYSYQCFPSKCVQKMNHAITHTLAYTPKLWREVDCTNQFCVN